jgi:hypothetical protein
MPMNIESQTTRRYFVSYSGVKLPLNLVNELDNDGLKNRNTYYCGEYDGDGRLIRCQKVVYGEVETEHVYSYYPDGRLKQAQISEDDEVNRIAF